MIVILDEQVNILFNLLGNNSPQSFAGERNNIIILRGENRQNVSTHQVLFILI